MRADLKSTLLGLTAEQQAEVSEWLATKGAPAPKTRISDALIEWYAAIGEAFRQEVGERVPPLSRALKLVGVQKLQEVHEDMDAYLKGSCREAPTKVEMYALRIAVTKLALKYYKEHPIGDGFVSIQALADNLRHMPQIVDRYFPGYARAGLLKMLANARLD